MWLIRMKHWQPTVCYIMMIIRKIPTCDIFKTKHSMITPQWNNITAESNNNQDLAVAEHQFGRTD